MPTSASGAAGYSVFYGYDVRGLQTFVRFGSTTGAGITNSYDGFGRLVSSTNNMGGTARTLSYRYDPGSRRDRLTFPGGSYFGYGHDPSGRLTAIRENGAAEVAGFTYDNAGRPWGATLSGASRTLGYDAISRLSSLSHNLAGTPADQNLGFSYNPASQIRTRTSANDAYASNTAYNVTRSYSVNGLNQYTAAGPATFLYDANGNLRSDGSTSFVYDAENRLVSASGARTAALAYDPLGRLFQTSGGSAGMTRFLYDGDELVAEYNASGTLLRRYVHGIGTDDPVLWYEGAGLTSRRSLFSDHQGSIVAVADSGGTAIAINGYDAWGIPNATNVGRFQYTGQAWIAELGMYYYKARIYSPTLGRFLQVDPVGYDDQINLYIYVGNDPVNFSDPSGQCRNRDDAGECLVRNRAGAERRQAAGRLQTQVRATDHAIRDMGNDETVTVRIGDRDRTMTGAQIKREWGRTDWTIDPAGTRYGNGMGGQISFGGHARFALDAFERFQATHVELRHGTAADAVSTLVLHEFGHVTPIGREVKNSMWRDRQFNERERRTSTIGRAIGQAIGRPFHCNVFLLGCSE